MSYPHPGQTIAASLWQKEKRQNPGLPEVFDDLELVSIAWPALRFDFFLSCCEP